MIKVRCESPQQGKEDYSKSKSSRAISSVGVWVIFSQKWAEEWVRFSVWWLQSVDNSPPHLLWNCSGLHVNMLMTSGERRAECWLRPKQLQKGRERQMEHKCCSFKEYSKAWSAASGMSHFLLLCCSVSFHPSSTLNRMRSELSSSITLYRFSK